MDDAELREQFRAAVRDWDAASEYIIGDPLDEIADRLVEIATARDAAKEREGHWYAGGYGRDANGLEIGYRCNCGFKAANKSTIHSHVDWKKAELRTSDLGRRKNEEIE